MGDFYGIGIEIWTGFGPHGNTEKKGLGVSIVKDSNADLTVGN